MLPSRSPKAEQLFLQRMQQESQAEIQDAITSAISERRPALAAQLLRLITPPQNASPALEKAKKALTFSILKEQQWQSLKSSWDDFTSSQRMARMRNRHRDKNDLRNRPWKKR